MSSRFRLRRPDGEVYLERWGFELGSKGRFGGIFIHHMSGPDPGKDLHDHPWWFGSLVLRGGYTEKRANTHTPRRWNPVQRNWLSWKALRQNECHTIYSVSASTWTLVIHGFRRSTWGFYTPTGWVEHHIYDDTRRGLKQLDAHDNEVEVD